MHANLVKDVREGINMRLAPLSVSQYHQMIDNGILEDGEPIELIEGALIYKDRRDESGGIKSHGVRHLRVLNKLMAILAQWTGGRPCHLQVQGPISIGETSEPEPDCCLVRGTPDDYADEVPQATDVLAVFEVAHSSLRSDRRVKQRLYASAGIPIYVIINLVDNMVEVHQQPNVTEQHYDQRTEFHRDETISLPMGDLGLMEWNVADVQ